MKRRILAFITGLALLVPMMATAATNSPADFTPSNATIHGDLRIPTSGRIHDLFAPLLDDAEGEMMDFDESGLEDDFTALAIKQLKKGSTFSLGFARPESVWLSFPVPADEWSTFSTKITEKESYNGADIFELDSATYMTRLGEFVVIAADKTDLQKAIDLSKGTLTDSLSSNANFNAVSVGFSSPRVFSLAVNLPEVVTLLKDEFMSEYMRDDERAFFNAILTYVEPLQMEGISLAENGNQYILTANVKGDAQKLAAKNMSLNPGGSFVPNLYTKLGNAKPIIYSESFNQKAAYQQTKQFTEEIFKSLENEAPEAAMVNEFAMEVSEKMSSVFTQESAFAVQYNTSSMFPYVTLMGNVSQNQTLAQSMADEIAATIKEFLVDQGAPSTFYTMAKEGNFTKFTFDLTKLPNYDGPKLEKITFVTGVTVDGLLIISNYPNIEQTGTRTGIAGDSDFSQFAGQLKSPIAQATYINARNIWGYTDNLLNWLDKLGANLALGEYRSYYTMLDSVYGFKDAFILMTGTSSTANVTATITVDKNKHQTFTEFVDEMKGNDTDNDDVSDFEEKYLYKTPANKADSDNDGVNDIEELRKALAPNGDGPLFSDVPMSAYYTDEVGFLTQRHAIRGYPDGSFQPGKLVNRAEFTAMVVKAFEKDGFDLSSIDPFDTSYDYQAFKDVSEDQWYYEPIQKAYRLGFVSGSFNSTKGWYEFRPGAPITRAEAITILNRASIALSSTRWDTYCEEMPFEDVHTVDWFCEPVLNAQNHGITSGKAGNMFKPFDSMTRAEAAVMIQRSLEKDVNVSEESGSGASSFEELLLEGF